MSERKLYEGLRDQVKTNVPRAAFISMWNNQVERLHMKKPDQFGFRCPAVFFEFIPGAPTYVMGGVQVFDKFKVRVHTVHELYNDSGGEVEINLDVFDFAADVHYCMQGFSVKGSPTPIDAQYGSSDLNRCDVEIDNDHDNIYHHISEYALTWTDNSKRSPIGGYEVDPPFQGDITAQKIPIYTAPLISVGSASHDFGNVTVGQSGVFTTTVQLQDSHTKDPIYLSAQAPFSLSLDGVTYYPDIYIPAVDGAVTATTFFIKFSPTINQSYSGDVNIGIPDLETSITLTGHGA